MITKKYFLSLLLVLGLGWLIVLLKQDETLQQTTNLPIYDKTTTGEVSKNIAPQVKDSLATQAIFGETLRYNSHFDQIERCNFNEHCDISIFSLPITKNLDFPITVIDVVEINAHAKLLSSSKLINDESDGAPLAILGEKAYVSESAKFGALHSYLEHPTYKDLKHINKQPEIYSFNPTPSSNILLPKVLAKESDRISLKPGNYASWLLKNNSTITLTAGNKYFVGNIEALGEAKIYVAKGPGKSTSAYIVVYGKLDSIPEILLEDKFATLTLIILNAQEINITKTFQGLLVCPYCIIKLNNPDNQFLGQLYARSLRVYPQSNFIQQQHDMLKSLTAVGDVKLSTLEHATGQNDDASTATKHTSIIFKTGNKEIDAAVTAFLESGGGYGDEQTLKYEATLKKLQDLGKESANAIYEHYQQLTPSIQNQAFRWKLVQTITAINSAHSIDALETIALNNNNAESFGYQAQEAERFNSEEQIIRFRALSGITALAVDGNIKAADALYRIATKKSGMEQSLAIQGYISSGDRNERLENIRRALPNFVLPDITQSPSPKTH
jgi:hypothetical protein